MARKRSPRFKESRRLGLNVSGHPKCYGQSYKGNKQSR